MSCLDYFYNGGFKCRFPFYYLLCGSKAYLENYNLGLKTFNPNYPKVFSKKFIPGRGAIVIPLKPP